MSEIAIIGAGAWGTALSIVLGRKPRHRVRLWAYEKEVCESIRDQRTNTLFLPDQSIPETVSVSREFSDVLDGAEILVSAMPSQHCRRLFTEISTQLQQDTLIVSATKGLEQQTFRRMTEVIREVTNSRFHIGAISGPTFASEVARGDPTAITIASKDGGLAATVQHEFS